MVVFVQRLQRSPQIHLPISIAWLRRQCPHEQLDSASSITLCQFDHGKTIYGELVTRILRDQLPQISGSFCVIALIKVDLRQDFENIWPVRKTPQCNAGFFLRILIVANLHLDERMLQMNFRFSVFLHKQCDRHHQGKGRNQANPPQGPLQAVVGPPCKTEQQADKQPANQATNMRGIVNAGEDANQQREHRSLNQAADRGAQDLPRQRKPGKLQHAYQRAEYAHQRSGCARARAASVETRERPGDCAHEVNSHVE